MQKLVDIYIVYQFIKRLTTPFDKTPAFELGIIDANGNVLRPLRTLKTTQEKNAWTWFDILINNIKRMLAKIPGGTNRLFKYLAAFWLLKEPIVKLREAATWDESILSESILGPDSQKYLNEAIALVDEEVPAMATGSGQVAGLGVGPQGEPGVQLPRKRKKEMDEETKLWKYNKRTGYWDHQRTIASPHDEQKWLETFQEDEPSEYFQISKSRPSKKPKLHEETFAGYEVFEVDSDTFQRSRLGKKKHDRYRTYVGTSQMGEAIRQYGRKQGHKGIILRDQTTGAMMFLRRPGRYM